MEEERWLSAEEEAEFRRLFAYYEERMDAEADAVAPLHKNEFSNLKAFMHELVREKYIEIIEREMGLPKERQHDFGRDELIKDTGKELFELNVDDFKAIYEDLKRRQQEKIDGNKYNYCNPA